MSGVEGYVESAASGLLAGLNAAALAQGEPTSAPAADDGDRRAGVLRVARRSGALRADEHHVRHHGSRSPSAAAKQDWRGKLAMSRRALADRALQALDRWMARSRRRAPVTGAVSAGHARDRLTAMRNAFLQFLAPQPQRLAAHGARLRERPRAVPRLTWPSRAGVKRPRSRRRRALDRAAIRGFLGDAARAGTVARDGGAEAGGGADVSRAICAAKALIDDDPGALVATPKREVRMPAHLSEDEMTRAARGAGRRRRRSDAAIARSSSCSTRRGCV